MSAGVALGYLFWTRHRRGLMAVVAYLLIVVIFCRLVLGGTFAASLDKDGTPGVVLFVLWAVFFLLCAGLAAALAYLLCIFSFSAEVRRFEACESGFPHRLRHLPLPTLALAGWPMLWGSATLVLGWLVVAWGAFRASGHDVPLIWPALLLAVFLAWLQAIIWTPFPLPWVRALLFFPASSVLVFVPLGLVAFDVSERIAYILLAVQLPAAYATAIHGVSRARRGENEHWDRPAWLRRPRKTMRPHPPFISADRAQLWFEWRRCGYAFPLTVAGCALIWFPLVVAFSPPQVGYLTVACVMFFSLLGLAPPCGALLGKLPGGERTRAMSSFLATRPLSLGALIRAKLKAAALGTLAGWTVLGIGMLFWILVGGNGAAMAKELEAMRQQQSVGRFGVALVLLLGGFFVLTWVQMVGHLWIGLMRRDSILALAIFFVSWPSALVLLDVGLHLKESPQSWQWFAGLLTWLASGVVVLKILAAAWAWTCLRRNALLPFHVVLAALAAWSALAIGLFVALHELIPPEIMPLSGSVLGIALLLPLTRLALAPLVLSWNRHR